VPGRLGRAPRLKILEAWAMGRPVVSTTLGAEGLDGVPDQHLLIADDPAEFARAVLKVLSEPKLADEIGGAGRALAVERYSWRSAARSLEAFFRQTLARRNSAPRADRRLAT
jgi:glycosyltransferase involved in cell wall biosynthesis